MFCVDRRYQPYEGRQAKARGCDKVGRLRVLERFPRLGFGHHPYTRKAAPGKRERRLDMLTIGEHRRAAAGARQDRRADRADPTRDARLLHRVRLRDAAAGPVQRRFAGTSGAVHQRGRLHRMEEPADLLHSAVPALRRSAADRVPARHGALLGHLPVRALHGAARRPRQAGRECLQVPARRQAKRRQGAHLGPGPLRAQWRHLHGRPPAARPRIVHLGHLRQSGSGDEQPGFLPGSASHAARLELARRLGRARQRALRGLAAWRLRARRA